LCGAGGGQQHADDGSHRVDESVRTAGRGSWTADESLQSAGEDVNAPCGCGPAPTSDLTQRVATEIRNSEMEREKKVKHHTVGECGVLYAAVAA
jgi:hypothetical protein